MFQILKGDLKAAPKAWVPGQERRVEEVRELRGEHAKKLAVQDALGLRDLDKVKGDLRKNHERAGRVSRRRGDSQGEAGHRKSDSDDPERELGEGRRQGDPAREGTVTPRKG